MKESGIIRKVDPLGRVVIPKEIRNIMDINEGDPIEIIKDDNSILLRKYSNGCIFCRSDKDVKEFMNLSVCSICRKALGQQ